MSTERAIEILDSAHELIAEMGRGNALGLQLKEISRCMCLVLSALPRPDNVLIIVNRLRSAAAWYAIRYVRDPISDAARAGNQARLETLIAAYTELRAHLDLQRGVRLRDGERPHRGRF